MMRVPQHPPDIEETLEKLANEDNDKLLRILRSDAGPTQNGKYLHWDKLRCYPPPEGMSHVDWWVTVKRARQALYTELPLWSKDGGDFKFAICDPIPKLLHDIDLKAGGHIQAPQQIINPETRDRYYVHSLIEEAITSSQLEGASTTHRVAKDMIRRNREPRDKSERMILNNFRTMKRIGQLKREALTPDLIFELHRIVTRDTLDDPSAAGRFRTPEENVHVTDQYDNVLHVPPSADSLMGRMEAMCEFANDMEPEPFVHPVIRAIVLHFCLAYDHPFVDGNGRTARAIFYWFMLHYGYWLFEFISISRIILNAPSKYGRAFLYTETDGEDATYFILYHLDVIERSIAELHNYIRRKSDEVRILDAQLRGAEVLNHRQRALISHALRHPNTDYTINSHKTSHNVVYQTARTDLLDLVDRGLMRQLKIGKTLHFRAAHELPELLQRMGRN